MLPACFPISCHSSCIIHYDSKNRHNSKWHRAAPIVPYLQSVTSYTQEVMLHYFLCIQLATLPVKEGSTQAQVNSAEKKSCCFFRDSVYCIWFFKKSGGLRGGQKCTSN